MRVQFYDCGNGSSAKLSAAVGLVSAIMFKKRILLINENSAGNGIEAGFNIRSSIAIESDAMSPIVDFGIDALLRLSSTQQLHLDNFADYTYPVIQEQLDLVTGRSDHALHFLSSEQFKSSLIQIYKLADRRYDMVITDGCSCNRSDTNSILLDHKSQRLRVVVVNHNREELDRVIGYEEVEKLKEGMNKIPIVIYHYDPDSKWNIRNIRRRYDCNNPIYGIPYSTGFQDAWNNGDVSRYLRRNLLLSHRRLQRHSLLSGMLQLSEGLLEMMNEPLGKSLSSNYKGA